MLSDHCLDPFKMFQTAQVNNSRKAGGKQSVGFRLFGVASATSPSAASQFAASRKVADPVAAAGRLIAILAGLCALTGCGGSGGTMPTASLTNVGVAVSPGTVSIQPEGSQQFVAAVTGASNGNVTWSVSLGGVQALVRQPPLTRGLSTLLASMLPPLMWRSDSHGGSNGIQRRQSQRNGRRNGDRQPFHHRRGARHGHIEGGSHSGIHGHPYGAQPDEPAVDGERTGRWGAHLGDGLPTGDLHRPRHRSGSDGYRFRCEHCEW